MRLFLDQMLRVDLAERLRSLGHDVLRASEIGQARGDDAEILARAVAEGRTLVTLDEHFGDWVVLPLSQHPGVIRVKAHPSTSENIAEVLLPLLAEHSQADFRNHLVIVSASRVRWVLTSED